MYNVVRMIKGTERPNEYVVLSAHFDSWAAASGATDNGTGTITMMEALRILRQVYPNPKRTILIGNWGSEEQGLNGSQAFAEDHPEIVKGIRAGWNQDNGTGRITSLGAGLLTNATDNLISWLRAVPSSISGWVRLGANASPVARAAAAPTAGLPVPRRAGARDRRPRVGLLQHHLAHQPRHLRQDRDRRPEEQRDARRHADLPGRQGPDRQAPQLISVRTRPPRPAITYPMCGPNNSSRRRGRGRIRR
ncbi:MAG: M20/M25/M40 family metallo-hydrolase [Gemmatimonadetes bacterium]|nr:M20/M25/M40 family metallo-hydrolase [Gemmatimonadota bacterium]